MSDDPWRRRAQEDDDDFGTPLFGDDPAERRGRLSFDDESGALPDWTASPTGQVPTFAGAGTDDTGADDVDVWSSFSGEVPVWSEDNTDPQTVTGEFAPLEAVGGGTPPRRGLFDDPDAELPRFGGDESAPGRRPPGRIQIGTDPTGDLAAVPVGQRGSRPEGEHARPTRPPRPSGPARPAPRPVGGTKGRDMPTAIAVGLLILAVFVGATVAGPRYVAIIVVLVLGLAAVEFYDRVREKGYGPAFVPGIVACVAAPVATYNYGAGALPVVLFLAFVACAVSFIGMNSLDSNPMPNMAITGLGIVWIGVLGSFGAAILGTSNLGGTSIGTDSLFLLAIAVVANDVGALFVGSAVGRTPLREWISPNKSIEGLLGGTVMTLGVMFLVGVSGTSETWNSTGDLLILGLVVSIVAPIGDLTESMFKRNLDVKDFGSIIRGHGGMLDRFDGFLFAMPAVYYLMQVLEPWVS